MIIKKDWVTLSILLLSIAGTFLTANFIYKRELNSSLQQLQSDVERYAAYIRFETERSLTLLATLKSFLSVAAVDQDVFHSVADDALARYQQLQGVVWLPLVAHKDRARSEQLQQHSAPGFEFKMHDGENLLRAPDHGFYLPLYYQRVKADIKQAMGLDLLTTEFGVSLKLQEEQFPGQVFVDMKPNFTVQPNKGDDAEYFLTVVLPVYHQVEAASHLTGFLMGAIRVESLLDNFLEDPRQQFIDITIVDVTNKDHTVFINVREDTPGGALLEEYDYRTEINTIAGRHWEITATPTEHYLDLVSSRQWIYAVIIGLLLNFLFALYIYTLRSRNLLVQQLVKKKTSELETANYKLQKLSMTDSLTQVANRRHFDKYLDAEWLRAVRENHSLSLLLIDIDFFKNYNDSHGHTQGDSCLQEVALSLRGCFTRPSDLFARYGGEEFAVVLPNTKLETRALIDKCCDVVEQQKIVHGSSVVSPYVTISIGACTLTPSSKLDKMQLLKAADKALYRAKNEGRNRGVVFDFQRDKFSLGITDSI